jgi:aminoglycoside 3-N-acetyltransferase
VIDGILEVIGADGTLMVPTFSYWAVDLFDPRITPGFTGLVTETLRLRHGGVRSLHPTHSVAAVGKRAREFTEGHEDVGALHIDSPIDKLAKAGGYTVLLGVRHDSNSAVHVGEAYARPWYLGFPFNATDPMQANILVEGSTRTVRLAGLQSGCSIAFNAVELPLREHGEIVDFKIGAALCQLAPTQAIINRTIDLIRDREDALLCSWANCFFCCNARSRHP